MTWKVIKKKTTYRDYKAIGLNEHFNKLMDDDFVILESNIKGQKYIDCIRLLLPWDPKEQIALKSLNDYCLKLGFTNDNKVSNRSKADYIVRINQISTESLLMVTI